MGGGATPLHRLLICDLKVLSKDTRPIVSTLNRHSAGLGLPLAHGGDTGGAAWLGDGPGLKHLLASGG